MIAATSASAILHNAQRQRDAQGRIIAEIADYQNAFEALNGGLTTAYAPVVSPAVISVVKALEDTLAEQRAEVEKKLHEWRKKNPQAANDPPPPELLPVTLVRATHSQLAGRLGHSSKALIGQRLRAALDARAIVRADPGTARNAAGEYQIVTTSAASPPVRARLRRCLIQQRWPRCRRTRRGSRKSSRGSVGYAVARRGVAGASVGFALATAFSDVAGERLLSGVQWVRLRDR